MERNNEISTFQAVNQDIEYGEDQKKTEAVVQLSQLKVNILMLGLALGVFFVALDSTIVATALPKIGSDFNALDQIAWVATAFLFTQASFQPTYGKVSDIFGRKLPFLFAIIFFELGSLLCGVAPNMTAMIAFRAISGLGGAGIMSLAMIIISDVVPLKNRGKYLGLLAAAIGIASLVGPLLGTTFTDDVTWRWCFFINLPFGAITTVVVFFLLPLRVPKGNLVSKLKRVDYLGTLACVSGTVGALLVVQWGGEKYAWTSIVMMALLAIASNLYMAFVYIEWKIAAEPIAPIRLFTNRAVAASFGVSFFQGMAFFASVYYIPLYFQVVKGESATASALELLPYILGVVFSAAIVGQAISFNSSPWRYMAISILGAAHIALGTGMISSLTENTSRLQQILYLLIPGVGIGMLMPTTVLVGQTVVPHRDMASVTSMINFFGTLGALFGVKVIGAVFDKVLTTKINSLNLNVSPQAVRNSAIFVSQLPDAIRQPVIHEYADSLGICFKVVAAMGVLCLLCAIAIWKIEDTDRNIDINEQEEVAEITN